MDIILRQEDIDRFNTILSNFGKKAGTMLSVLIHKDGHLLAAYGSDPTIDTTVLSALVSANFSSTLAVANLIGEKEFKTQFHSGKNRSVFVSLVDSDTFLTSVFDNKTSLDTVKVYTEEYSRNLADSLQILYNNDPDEFANFPVDETVEVRRSQLHAQAGLQQNTVNQAHTPPVQPPSQTQRQPQAQESAPPPPQHKAAPKPATPHQGAQPQRQPAQGSAQRQRNQNQPGSKPKIPQQSVPRVLPHTGKKKSAPVVSNDEDIYFIEAPDDYYSHRIRENPSGI